jgi:hypothetical protein
LPRFILVQIVRKKQTTADIGGGCRLYRFVIIATESTEGAEMVHGNGRPSAHCTHSGALLR